MSLNWIIEKVSIRHRNSLPVSAGFRISVQRASHPVKQRRDAQLQPRDNNPAEHGKLKAPRHNDPTECRGSTRGFSATEDGKSIHSKTDVSIRRRNSRRASAGFRISIQRASPPVKQRRDAQLQPRPNDPTECRGQHAAPLQRRGVLCQKNSEEGFPSASTRGSSTT